jgi:hypothetical protein
MHEFAAPDISNLVGYTRLCRREAIPRKVLRQFESTR